MFIEEQLGLKMHAEIPNTIDPIHTTSQNNITDNSFFTYKVLRSTSIHLGQFMNLTKSFDPIKTSLQSRESSLYIRIDLTELF